MKSAKKVRVPRNKKITPKRKKMRSKPRKQSKKRKHRGGAENLPLATGATCNVGLNECKLTDWCKPNFFSTKGKGSRGTCTSRLTDDKIKQGYKPSKNNLLEIGNLDYSNCPVGTMIKLGRNLSGSKDICE